MVTLPFLRTHGLCSQRYFVALDGLATMEKSHRMRRFFDYDEVSRSGRGALVRKEGEQQ